MRPSTAGRDGLPNTRPKRPKRVLPLPNSGRIVSDSVQGASKISLVERRAIRGGNDSGAKRKSRAEQGDR